MRTLRTTGLASGLAALVVLTAVTAGMAQSAAPSAGTVTPIRIPLRLDTNVGRRADARRREARLLRRRGARGDDHPGRPADQLCRAGGRRAAGRLHLAGRGHHPGPSDGGSVHSVGLIQQKAPYGLIVGPDRGIAVPKDLEGHKIGTQPDNTYYALWKAFEAAQGLDASKITEVPIGFGPEPLYAGQVDAVPDFISLVPAYVSEHYGEPRPSRSSSPTTAPGPRARRSSSTTSSRPPIPTRCAASWRHTARACAGRSRTRTRPSTSSWSSSPDLPRDVVSVELPALLKFWTSPDTDAHGLLYQGPEVWQRTYDMLHQFGGMTDTFDVSDAYTNDYLTEGL